MKLYEINPAIESLHKQMIYIANNDELTEAEQEKQLQELQMRLNQTKQEFKDKALDIACLVKQEETQAEAIKAYGDKIREKAQEHYDRAKSHYNNARFWKRYLKQIVPVTIKFEDERAKISWRKSEILEIDEGTEDRIPEKYVNWLPKVIKSELKKDIKSGITVLSNCRIVEKQNLQIK